MDEVPSTHAQLKPLFDPEIPNHPILFACLHGHVDTIAVVDDPEEPAMAALRTPDGITFLSREMTDAFLRGALRKLQSHGPAVPIVSHPVEMFPKPDITIPRFEFKDHDAAAPEYLALLETIPDGMTFVPMDAGLMEKCEWRDLIQMVYGTVENFLQAAYGYCLMDGDRVVTEIYGAFTGAGGTEIGVVTAEADRGKGYGALASAYLIREIIRRGQAPYWSCDQSNIASAATARKLGFRTEGEYILYGYRPLVAPMGGAEGL